MEGVESSDPEMLAAATTNGTIPGMGELLPTAGPTPVPITSSRLSSCSILCNHVVH